MTQYTLVPVYIPAALYQQLATGAPYCPRYAVFARTAFSKAIDRDNLKVISKSTKAILY